MAKSNTVDKNAFALFFNKLSIVKVGTIERSKLSKKFKNNPEAIKLLDQGVFFLGDLINFRVTDLPYEVKKNRKGRRKGKRIRFVTKSVRVLTYGRAL